MPLVEDGVLITQSLAIIERIGHLSSSAATRGEQWLDSIPGIVAAVVREWNRHRMQERLSAIEVLLSRHPKGPFAVGNTPSVADIIFFTQVINAERAGLSLERWPRIAAVVSTLRTIPAFAANTPSS